MSDTVVSFTVPGTTASKSNSYRVCRNRIYKTKTCMDFERRIKAAAREAMNELEMLEGEVECCIALFFPDKRRRDIDGPLKSALDACNLVVYKDDSQVVTLIVTKQVDKSNPRMEMMFSSV